MALGKPCGPLERRSSNSRDFFHDQSALNALEVFQAAGEAVDHSLQEAGGESAGVEFEVVALIHTEHGNGHCTPVLRRYPVQHGQDICLGLALCKHPLHPEPLLLKIYVRTFITKALYQRLKKESS